MITAQHICTQPLHNWQLTPSYFQAHNPCKWPQSYYFQFLFKWPTFPHYSLTKHRVLDCCRPDTLPINKTGVKTVNSYRSYKTQDLYIKQYTCEYRVKMTGLKLTVLSTWRDFIMWSSISSNLYSTCITDQTNNKLTVNNLQDKTTYKHEEHVPLLWMIQHTELRFYISSTWKQVISEMFLLANYFIWYRRNDT